MNKQQIKELALANGFKLKQQPSGEMELNSYVYDFAEALIAKVETEYNKLKQESLAFRAVMDESLRFHPASSPDYVVGYQDGMRRFEDIYLGEAGKVLHKYYIKKQIEAINEVLDLGKIYTIGDIDQWQIDDEKVELHIEQLRKGIEK